jgi:hypothetical protein
MDAIRGDTEGLEEQSAPSLAHMGPWWWKQPGWPGGLTRGGPPDVLMMATPAAAAPKGGLLRSLSPRFSAGTVDYAAALAEGRDIVTETEAKPLSFVAVPSREDFPELAYMELLPVRDVLERTVPLGDQIGTWRCRAYLVAGLDVLELTADVEAAKAVYAELDLPAIVGEGDDILAGVRYHTQQPATMTITLPDGNAISGGVMGHGTETFHLTQPGDVTVRIQSPDGEDWTTRAVKPPGVQMVTASRLDILRRGQTIRAERVVVYPGPANVLKETIEALGRYPFG